MCISSRDGKNNNNNTVFTAAAAMSSQLRSIICKYIYNLGYLVQVRNLFNLLIIFALQGPWIEKPRKKWHSVIEFVPYIHLIFDRYIVLKVHWFWCFWLGKNVLFNVRARSHSGSKELGNVFPSRVVCSRDKRTRRQQYQYKYICLCIFYQYLGTFDFGWPAEVIREYKY